MSLTSILSDKFNDELRDKLKIDFIKPDFKLKTEVKAAPLTKNYGLVGTAFDYLMRFYLQYHNKGTFIQRDKWVADNAYKALTNYLSRTKRKEIQTGFFNDKTFKTKHLLKIIKDQYAQTKKNYSQFILDGQFTNDLVTNSIYLAKLDVYYRTKIIDQNFDFHNPDDVKDLNAIISLLDTQKFIAKEKCYFNPTFGKASSLVGGADADLILDNTLIDIKATKNLRLDRKHLNQVLGYYVLSLIGGINNKPSERPIENIGIYFARHGELWSIPINQLGDKSKFEEFRDWFISYVSHGRVTMKDMMETILPDKGKLKKKRIKKLVDNKKGIRTAKKRLIVKKKVRTVAKKKVKKGGKKIVRRKKGSR